MLIHIDEAILNKYPQAEIGYLIAEVSVKKSDPFVEDLKGRLKKHIEKEGVNATNFVLHPSIASWRKVYEEEFQVKAKTYRSALESLVRRVITGKDIWNICNIVDLYNCCSVLSMLPMGGYDMSKITGNITIRYAKDGEFFRALGEREKIAVAPAHIVYADDARIITWLWNHKDSQDTCIDRDSKTVIFFIDSLEPNRVQAALNLLREHLETIGCTPLAEGIINQTTPQVVV